MHEDGIGMARTFELEFARAVDDGHRRRAGFFACGRSAHPLEGYRAPASRLPAARHGGAAASQRTRRSAILTGSSARG